MTRLAAFAALLPAAALAGADDSGWDLDALCAGIVPRIEAPYLPDDPAGDLARADSGTLHAGDALAPGWLVDPATYDAGTWAGRHLRDNAAGGLPLPPVAAPTPGGSPAAEPGTPPIPGPAAWTLLIAAVGALGLWRGRA